MAKRHWSVTIIVQVMQIKYVFMFFLYFRGFLLKFLQKNDENLAFFVTFNKILGHRKLNNL